MSAVPEASTHLLTHMFPNRLRAMNSIRERLLDAAARVYAETGVRGATTRRIAHEAGVNEVTLFRHFGSKDTLLQEALAWESRQVIEGVGLPAEPVDPHQELLEFCRRQHRVLLASGPLIRTSMA